MKKKYGLFDLNATEIFYRALPHVLGEAARRYFRLSVEGLENIPRRGGALILPNHSGYSGFDALLLNHEIYKSTGRVPRVLTHYLWFRTKLTSLTAHKFGFVEASFEHGIEQLKKQNLVILFPEGEFGNFKPTFRRYHLQPFKRGFVRMALLRQVPIVPTLVLGAEETHITLSQLRLPGPLKKLIFPLPLNVIPLPARWKIVFLPPIHLPYGEAAVQDAELVHEIATEIRENMQKALSAEVAKRGSIYF